MTSVVDAFLLLATNLESMILKPLLDPVESHVYRAAINYFPLETARLVDFFVTQKSVHSQNFPMMNVFHVLFISVLYLAIVFVGKAVMAHVVKEKLTLKTFSQIHNLFLVLLSAYMGTSILHQAIFVRGYQLFDNPNDLAPAAFPLAKLIWLFYFSKIFEFIDTFIMIMKKNFRQVSFLHVYHHVSIFGIWWFVVFMAPTSEAYFSAVLNSYIHVLMYSYYFVASLGVARNLVSKLKPLITSCQLTQFCLMMVQASYDIVSAFNTSASERKAKYPVLLTSVLWLYMCTMLALFADFFAKSYTKKGTKLKADGKKE